MLRLVLIGGALLIATIIGVTVIRDTSGLGPSDDLGGALIVAGEVPACGFPPLSPRFTVEHARVVRIAQCLERRGYLSDFGVANIKADSSYAVTGSWDGTPGASDVTWRTPFGTSALVGLRGTSYLPTGLVLAGLVGLALVIWWWRLRRRKHPTLL